MSDIVERLRHAHPSSQQYAAGSMILSDAADEIERLRVENEALRDELEVEIMRLAACGTAALGYFEGCKDEYRSASLDDVLRLYAENATLREALEKSQQAAPKENKV